MTEIPNRPFVEVSAKVPEGHLKVARQFIAGYGFKDGSVPAGRLRFRQKAPASMLLTYPLALGGAWTTVN
jgi:hypothetical protein